MYDITKAETFRNLNIWLEDVKTYAGECSYKMVIGNKSDLQFDREVSEEQVKTFSNHFNIGDNLETSAKVTNLNDKAYITYVLFWKKNKTKKNMFWSYVTSSGLYFYLGDVWQETAFFDWSLHRPKNK